MAKASKENKGQRTLARYLAGFIFSILLTILAYLLVVHHAFSSYVLIILIIALALVQFLVQLEFFLHIGEETKPRWRLMVLLFMILVVSVLVFGSLWIMSNLNYRMMPTTTQENNYLNSQDGL